MARKTTAQRLHLLTAKEVQAAKDGDYSDGGGLTLRVSDATNSSSWVLRYSSPSGRRREMGLGPALRGSLQQAGQSLTSARDAAHEAREELRRGVDPLDSRDQKRAAAREAEQARKAQKERERWTLARAARDYHEREVEPVVKSAKHSAQWIGALERHVPAHVWNMPIADITPPMLLEALKTAAPHETARRHSGLGETLRRVLQRLSLVFLDAQFHGRITSNPCPPIGGKLGKARPVKKTSHAALPYAEVPAFMVRLRSMQGTAARALEFGVLTASRTAEILFATWEEIDTERKEWRIDGKRMKSGEPHVVHLSARALEILEGQRGQHPEIVFPSAFKRNSPLSNMALLTTLDRLNVRDKTTVHGLCRASFSTWAYEVAAAREDVVEASLAHREADRVKSAYNRAEYLAERRALMEKWATFCARPLLALAA